MINRPKRPTDTSPPYNIFAERAWAYMDAIEQERDEAVRLLNEYLFMVDAPEEIENACIHLLAHINKETT